MQSGYSELNDSKNQFMGVNQNDLNPQQFRKFYGMMMQFMQNPSLVNSMLQDSRTHSDMQQNHVQTNRRSKNLEENQSMNYKAQSKVAQPMKRKHQKGGDVLKAYLPAQENDHIVNNKSKNYGSPKLENLNMENSVISTFQQNQSLIQEKNPQIKSQNTFDDVPIQSTYINQMVGRANNTSRTINSPRSGPQDIDDRPITGGTKNFEDMLNEQLAKQGLPPQSQSKYPIKINTFEYKDQNRYNYGNMQAQQQAQYQQNQDYQKGNKKFLKKGTRQFLSSAKYSNKSKKKEKNPDQTLRQQNDNSRIKVGDRDLTPKQTRAKSQNRILNNRKKPDNSVNKVQKKQFYQNLNDSVISSQQQANNLQLSRKVAPTPPKQKTMTTTTRVAQKNVIQSQKATPPQNKKVINIFQGDSSESQGQLGIKHSNYVTKRNDEWQQRQSKKSQIIKGVYLTEEQLQQILKKCSPQIQSQQQKLSNLRQKYQELCKINQDERNQMKQDLQNEREQFQQYKQSQIQKLKNQKRVIERQYKSGNSSSQNKDYKEQNQMLKKQLEKQKEQNKKRQKNNKIIIDKWKKQAQELKAKLVTMQMQMQKLKQNPPPPSNMQTSKNSARPSNNPIKTKRELQKQQKITQSKNYFDEQLKNKSTLPEYQKIKSTSNQNPYQKYGYVDEDHNKNKTMGHMKAKKINEEQLFTKNKKIQEMEYSDSNQDQLQQDVAPLANYYPNDIKLAEFLEHPPQIQKLTQNTIDNLFRYEHNPQYLAYLHKKQSPSRKLMHTSQNSLDGRTTNIYSDGSKQVLFTTGVKKQYFDNGYTIIHFKNGDIKQKLTDNTILYFFNEKGVDQITFPNKVNIYRFQNNQLEIHFGDDRVHIRHPDGTLKMIGQ